MFGAKPNKTPDVYVSVTNRTIIRALVLVVLFVMAFVAVRQAQHALILIFIAFFLALALNSPVHWLAMRLPGKRRGSRPLAVAISFIVVIGLLSGFIASLAPALVRQTNNFIAAAPGLVQELHSQDNGAGRFIRRYNLESQLDNFSGQLQDRLKHATGAAVDTVAKVGSSIFAVLTILVLTFMMLIEGPRWLHFAAEVIPDEHMPRAKRLATQMYQVVKGYVNGQVILAALASVLILPALLILGVNYPFALMVVVFICGLIPLVGHTLGAIIVSSVALFHSPLTAVVILAYYILYQQIENYVIQPRIQANHTNISPLTVLVSVVIGVNFGGLFGGLVAIPVAACLRILLLEFLHTKKIIGGEKALLSATESKSKS